MDREPVNSSAIASVGFSLGFLVETPLALADLPGILEIEFTDGTVYQYRGVRTSTYKDFLESGSLGAYFNQQIRDQYPTG